MNRKSNLTCVGNAVVRKLEAGNGNIKNMKLLLPIDNEALVAVTVVGISFDRYSNNGVAVLVRPIDGYGTLSVSASELLDDTKAARALYTAKAACAEYLRNHTPPDRTSIKGWREAVIRERLALNDKQRKTFDSLGKKHFRADIDMLKGVAEASEYTLKEVFKSAVEVRYGVYGPSRGDDL